MSVKKPSLGRGLAELSPLMAQRAKAPPAEQAAAAGDRLASLPLDLLQRGKYQPRVDMRPETLQDLADSIKSQGIVQPILVRPLAPREPGESQRYEIIAGERRWRAAQLAGLAEIPAVVRDVPDEAAVAMALIENIQRENLNPLEEARALTRLIEEFGLTHQAAAEAVGRSRAAVSNLLRLMDLADEVKELLEQRRIEMGHARALLGPGLTRPAGRGRGTRGEERSIGARYRGPRAAAAESPAAGRGSRHTEDPDIRRLELELAEKLGAKVLFQHASSGRGKMILSYNSLDELEGILAHIQ